MLKPDDIQHLKDNVFFGSLPEPVLDRLIAKSPAVVVREGDTIFHQGEDAYNVYCVIEGDVKLTVSAANGDMVVVDVFREGESFAEALAFRDAPYPASATALSDCRIVAVPKHLIQHEMKANPDSYPAMLSALYSHLHRLLRQIKQLKASSSTQRAAEFVLALADSKNKATEFDIPYEKQTIASMLGIQPETLSRAFRRLEEHGLRVSGQKVHIFNRAAIVKFLNES